MPSFMRYIEVHAPLTGFLIRNECIFKLDSSEKTILEYETLQSSNDDNIQFLRESLALPVTRASIKICGDEDKAIQRVLELCEATLVKELRKVAHPIKKGADFRKEMYDRRYYGPFLMYDDLLIQLMPSVVRIVTTEELEIKAGQVRTIIVPQVGKDFYGNYGIGRFEE